MFSTWKTDANGFDVSPRPQPETIAAAPMRVVNAAPVSSAHTSEGASVINEWLKMRGDLEGDGDILVKGEVHGNIRCKMLVIDQGAVVEGGVEADDVVIRGTARGTIRTKRIRLERTALVDCEIYHQSFSAEEGARVKGMMHAVDPQAAAPAKDAEPKAFAAKLKVAASSAKAPVSPEAKVSSALYDMLDVARTTSSSRG